MAGAMLLAWGIAMVVWRPCRNLEGRAPRAVVALMLVSPAAIWLGSFAVAVQLAAAEPAAAWTACGVLWQQILTGEVVWWRVLPLAFWFLAVPVRGAVALLGRQVALSRMARRVLEQYEPMPGRRNPVVVAGLGTPALALGLLRPRVVVDLAFWQTAAPDERQVVLAHEFAHARGGHALIEAAATFLLAPLRPMAVADDVYECVRRHLEALADDRAVRVYGKETVGRTLGNVALETFPSAGLAATGACVWRVNRLLAPREELAMRDRCVMTGMVLMMVLMFVGAGGETAGALGPVNAADFCPLPA